MALVDTVWAQLLDLPLSVYWLDGVGGVWDKDLFTCLRATREPGAGTKVWEGAQFCSPPFVVCLLVVALSSTWTLL